MTISNTIESYRKHRRTPTPIIIGIAAVVLVVTGIIIVAVSLSGGKLGKLFATKTPTPTITPTSTNTPMPTDTPTITPTPTNTTTPTPSGPYNYVIQQGDYLNKIATDHGLDNNGVSLILLLNPYNPNTGEGIDPNHQDRIRTGQTIILPPPSMKMPTATPWPTGLAPGTKITYFVLPGDSLGSIARKCNSTIDAIIAANKTQIPDTTTVIQPGWILQVPINLVTPGPTTVPSATVTATP